MSVREPCLMKITKIHKFTHAGANKWNPKERQETKYQHDGTDKCACSEGTDRPCLAGMIAVSTCDHCRSVTQIPPQNPGHAIARRDCRGGAGRCARGGGSRRPWLLKICDRYLPPVVIDGGRNDLGERRCRGVNGCGRNCWDDIVIRRCRWCRIHG
jgi:hypothetical protein